MDSVVAALRAAAEPTRLRVLAICAHGELTVTEITQILGLSQPRVSHHLKLLCDAGLLERFKEGTWVFYRVAEEIEAGGGALARLFVELLPQHDPQLSRDRAKLDQVKHARAEAAAAYFRSNAARWDMIRSLHVDEREVERAVIEALPADAVRDLLDVGTGTGGILQLLAGSIGRGVGIDLSRDMIAVARVNLEAAGVSNCQVRHADMYQIPMADESFDAVTIHQVLHYSDRPAAAVAEAGRLLRPGGTLVIVDFAPHELEHLREEHAHRRLGFNDQEVADWCRGAALEPWPARCLPGDPLTVNVWRATRPAIGAGGDRARGIGQGEALAL